MDAARVWLSESGFQEMTELTNLKEVSYDQEIGQLIVCIDPMTEEMDAILRRAATKHFFCSFMGVEGTDGNRREFEGQLGSRSGNCSREDMVRINSRSGNCSREFSYSSWYARIEISDIDRSNEWNDSLNAQAQTTPLEDLKALRQLIDENKGLRGLDG